MSGSPSRAVRAILWISLLAAACGGESGIPTSPSDVGGVGTGATIEGQVDGASASVGLTVTVIGSAVSALVDGSGRFTLDNVPPGTVQLRFAGSGVDAVLDIGVVWAGQVVRITVMISGSSAALVPTNLPERTQFEGVLTSLGGACPNVTFRVNGVLVRTSAATVFDSGGCAALANGDQVQVDAVLQPDGSVIATTVEVDEPTGGGPPAEEHLEGMLTSLGGACPNVTFRIDGTLVRTSPATVFDGGGCAALANGDQVRVEGALQPDGSVIAATVEVDDAAGGGPPTQEDLEGVLTGLGGACPNVTFRVNGIQIQTSPATVFAGDGCAALSNGDQARVRGFLQPDGSVLASDVEVNAPNTPPDPGVVVLTLVIDPDEWRLEWAGGSQSGGGGANVTTEIRGSSAQQIAPGTVTLSGPSGSISPVKTVAAVDMFEAEFAKIEAIGVIGNAPEGGTVVITIDGALFDGTPFSLAQQVDIRK